MCKTLRSSMARPGRMSRRIGQIRSDGARSERLGFRSRVMKGDTPAFVERENGSASASTEQPPLRDEHYQHGLQVEVASG